MSEKSLYNLYVLLRPSSSQSSLGPVDPLFRVLSGRLKFMVRRHKFKKYSSLFEPLGVSGKSLYKLSSTKA